MCAGVHFFQAHPVTGHPSNVHLSWIFVKALRLSKLLSKDEKKFFSNQDLHA